MQAGLDPVVQANPFPWDWLASWSMGCDEGSGATGILSLLPCMDRKVESSEIPPPAIGEKQVEEVNVSRTAEDSGESLSPCRLTLVIA